MRMRGSRNQTSVSVEGVEYPVVEGVVELPDTLHGATVRHLEEAHGMRVDTEAAHPVSAPGKKKPFSRVK